MKALFTSDIHLSPRPRDEYRWRIFDWLRVQALSREVRSIFLLGDLTDQKDRHTNEFINRIVDALAKLASEIDGTVDLLVGNHDYTEPSAPLLRFLNSDPVRVYFKPELIEREGERIWMLPHSRAPIVGWRDLDLKRGRFALCHQTFDGALVENGEVLKVGLHPGDLSGRLARNVELISGDVHVPQTLGSLVYCGSPHPIRFGDRFQPRVLYYDGNELLSIKRVAIRKVIAEVERVEDLAAYELDEEDQAKVVFALPRSRFGEWDEIRRAVEELAQEGGWLLVGVELVELDAMADKKLKEAAPVERLKPVELFERFCEANAIEKPAAELGRRLVAGT